MIAAFKAFMPAVFILMGGILVAGAWFFASAFPTALADKVFSFDIAVCLVSIAYAVATLFLNRRATWRGLMALLLLSLGIVSSRIQNANVNSPGYVIMTAQLISLAGIAFMFPALLHLKAGNFLLRAARSLINAVERMPQRLFQAILFVLFLAVTISISWYCFHFLPMLCDTNTQYIHAKSFAAGHLYAPKHPLDEFFPSSFKVINGDKWYSPYQPLSVFLIALGHLVGAPWLANPLEGALTLLVIYAITRRIADEPTARIAALLTLGCQMILFMSSEYMNHAGALLFTSLFVLCYIQALETCSKLWALGAGLSIGAVFLIRPLTCVEAVLPAIFYSLYLLTRAPREYISLFSVIAAGGLACLAFQGWYDLQTSGKLFEIPYGMVPGNIPGFNENYGLWDALVKAQNEWHVLNVVLFEWAAPSSFFALLALMLPLKNAYQRLLVAMAVSAFGMDMLNHLEFYTLGPRYIYESALPLIILSAIGIRNLPALLAYWRFFPQQDVLQPATAFVMLALFASAIAYRLPENLKTYSGHYGNNHPEFYDAMLAQSEKPALIFIERLSFSPAEKYWWVDFTNPPSDDAPIIFATDLGLQKDRKLIAYYPKRNAYIEKDGKLTPVR